MRRNFVLPVLILGAAACVVHGDGEGCSYDDEYVCYLEYTPGFGYERVCEWTLDPVVCVELDADDDAPPNRYPRRSASASRLGETSGSADPAAEPSREAPEAPSTPLGSDIPCTRDGQCGTGLCIEGECFYGCQTAAECGTGDVCVLVNTSSVCQVAAEPELECTRTAECANAQVCLNAACHDSCETSADCSNPLDRCTSSICVPDRSVVSECLLDRECPGGQVCIDASCPPR